MSRLTLDEFKATMAGKPSGRRAITADEQPPFDFWTYFDSLPRTEWEGHDFSAGGVSDAYVMPDERWEHVLVSCEDKNVKLVLVLDLEHLEVRGHYLLDLNKMYGLEDR